MICFKHFEMLCVIAKGITLGFLKIYQQPKICRQPVLIRHHRYIHSCILCETFISSEYFPIVCEYMNFNLKIFGWVGGKWGKVMARGKVIFEPTGFNIQKLVKQLLDIF